jgi:hypothetical protein
MHSSTSRSTRLALSSLSVAALAFAVSCGDSSTAPGGEQELISRVTLTFTPEGGGTPVTAYIDDPDGAGPLPPTTQVGALGFAAGTNYSGSVLFENRLETPPENITEEVEAEADEHRVFYTVVGAGLDIDITDQDGLGRPLGVTFSATSSPTPANGSLRVVLCHYGDSPKPSAASSCTVDTDIDVTFTYSVNN